MQLSLFAQLAFLALMFQCSQLAAEGEQTKTESATNTDSIRSSITFQATFNKTLDADIARGDKQIRTADSLERKTSKVGLLTDAVEWDKSNGKTGGSLRFRKATKQLLYFNGGKNLPYKSSDFAGTVSFWMRLSPKEDLPKGYVDPLQITDKKWNDASFFVDFDQSKERPFRLGAFSDLKFWNPKDRKFEEIPVTERPMVTVKDWPFDRTKWTHVAFTWSGFNTEKSATARLYLNGKPQGKLARPQQFTWKAENAVIMLGINYVGWMDDLTIFDRPLSEQEISQMSK